MESMDDDTELMILLSEQRRELTAAMAADSDLDFAFQLQMQEAITISSKTQPSSSSSSQQPLFLLNEVTESPSGIAHLVAAEIDNFERSKTDRALVEAENRKMQDNLNRLIHDQVFAKQITEIPENQWRQTGDWFEKPYGNANNNNNNNVCNEEVFRVYSKGLVSEEKVIGMNVKMMFGGIGIAICDTRDNCVFEVRKSVGSDCDGDLVEVKALIEALNAAVALGLKRMHVFCDNNSVYGYLTGKRQPTNNQIVALVDQLNLIQRKFAYCGAFFVRQNDIKFAFQLARDAISTQATKFAENASGKILLEQCSICFESIYSGQMFTVNKCLHRYCFSCMRKYVEAKLLQGMLPECPQDKCKANLEIESCKTFLDQKLYDMMSSRVKEASIPPTEKVYCPYSNCSALMSKTEVQEYTATSSSAACGMRKCVKCRRPFCINCKVIWHDNVTCTDYLKYFANQSSSEAKLKSLATRNRWRQCIKCKHMVELATGCYHIYCRCGHEFCYTCGAEWISKKPTCKCPIWDERNLIYQQNRR